MKVVILCGGKGTRLREETEYRPKPMVPIGNRPILWHIMKLYAAHGFKEFILCLGYKGDMIKDFFRNYLWMTATSPAPRPQGQRPIPQPPRRGRLDRHAGRHRRGNPHRRTHPQDQTLHLGDDPEFFLTYGDGVGNIDINASLAFHRQHGKKLTVTAVRPPGRFGELNISPEGRSLAVQRKTAGHRRPHQWRILRRLPRHFRLSGRIVRTSDVRAKAGADDGGGGPIDGFPARRLLAADGYVLRVQPPQPPLVGRQRAVEDLVTRNWRCGDQYFPTPSTKKGAVRPV
jgi:hypothetical protein